MFNLKHVFIRFGTEGIVYGLFGSGAELFTVDNRTGVITVAFCATPGEQPCLDFETQPDFFLNYKVKIYFLFEIIEYLLSSKFIFRQLMMMELVSILLCH